MYLFVSIFIQLFTGFTQKPLSLFICKSIEIRDRTYLLHLSLSLPEVPIVLCPCHLSMHCNKYDYSFGSFQTLFWHNKLLHWKIYRFVVSKKAFQVFTLICL